MKYVFHFDPGHGWLEVKKSELVRLGIADKITSYSYMRGDKVYLEEDCDYSTFLRAKEAAGEKVAYVENYQEYSPIRGYDYYE